MWDRDEGREKRRDSKGRDSTRLEFQAQEKEDDEGQAEQQCARGQAGRRREKKDGGQKGGK